MRVFSFYAWPQSKGAEAGADRQTKIMGRAVNKETWKRNKQPLSFVSVVTGEWKSAASCAQSFPLCISGHFCPFSNSYNLTQSHCLKHPLLLRSSVWFYWFYWCGDVLGARCNGGLRGTWNIFLFLKYRRRYSKKELFSVLKGLMILENVKDTSLLWCVAEYCL